MMFVSLAQARAHLRSDTDADDEDLLLKIRAASEAVLDYIGDALIAHQDSSGEFEVDSDGVAQGIPARVMEATLLTIGESYNERAGSRNNAVDAQHGYGYTLPKGATAKLYSLRKPVVK